MQQSVAVIVCSYLKEYLDEPSELRQVKETEIALVAGLQRWSDMPEDASMLLIHHAILNQDLHNKCWTDYLYQQSFRGQSSLIIASHAIWLMAFLPLRRNYSFQYFDYDWIRQSEQTSLQRVDGIVGASREMQYFQYRITMEARENLPGFVDHKEFLLEIENSQQIVDEEEDELPKRIALRTALTYKWATLLYANVRLRRYVLSQLKLVVYLTGLGALHAIPL